MSDSLLTTTLEHLGKLVSFDTQNPPRNIQTNSAIFNYLQEELVGFEFEFFDAGDGCIALLATQGEPEILFNYHIDTVPAATNWTLNPFSLTLKHGKAYGLGTCDIKGAAACMLSALAYVKQQAPHSTQHHIALLFSSDEEFGSSKAIHYFLAQKNNYKKVIVAEPTQAKAVLAHRGIQSATAVFKGIAGHGSEKRALTESAIHKACQWSSSAIDWIKLQKTEVNGLTGIPFNIGKIAGGIKANMIAENCELTFGFRPLPGQDSKQLLKKLAQLSTDLSPDKIDEGFFGPSLPAANIEVDEAFKQATLLAKEFDLTIGNAVNFWTEASLFSQAGNIALVFGPGNIEQAHTADEWVALEQLEIVTQHYVAMLKKINSSKLTKPLSPKMTETVT